MDDRTGQIYDTRDAALAAGVPEQHVRQLAEYIDDRHCASCGKAVKVRRSTPTKQGSDGRLYRWCKRCWYTRGAAASER